MAVAGQGDPPSEGSHVVEGPQLLGTGTPPKAAHEVAAGFSGEAAVVCVLISEVIARHFHLILFIR